MSDAAPRKIQTSSAPHLPPRISSYQLANHSLVAADLKPIPKATRKKSKQPLLSFHKKQNIYKYYVK
jgi:hypothetical protein